jgi:1,2-diacylglycerol 3-beta-glucosyltransferase
MMVAVGALNTAGLASAVLTIGLIDLLALTAYVCRGWMLSGIGIEGAWDLLRVPIFLFWKLVIVRLQPKPATWIRTQRERRAPAGEATQREQ